MEEIKEKRPKVGIGVVIFKDGKILLGQRKNILGDGAYATPGGHFEHGESFEACARREVMEETGMEIDNIHFLCITNIKNPSKHYVGLALRADWKSGEPKNMEPEKSEDWHWYNLDRLPAGTLFGILPMALEALKTDKNFFDN